MIKSAAPHSVFNLAVAELKIPCAWNRRGDGHIRDVFGWFNAEDFTTPP